MNPIANTSESSGYLKSKLKLLLSERNLGRLRTARLFWRLARDEIKSQLFGQLFSAKPLTLNLLVNDVCNSRCEMCLIWKQKKDKEISADELRNLLQDDLFSELRYVGVSGGESTLREDLPDLFEVICSARPNLQGVGIITNGILEEVVKQRILQSYERCKKHGISFNVMISLDGLGDIHDRVRGRKNNFESAISLLKFFHGETEIPTCFGCTITTTNALYVDDLLEYVQAEGIYGRFRIAEFIDRLYNEEQSTVIRAFNEKLAYHLGLFFFRLEHGFEKNEMFQKTYRSIRGMIAEGKTRQTGCPYQENAVVLTSRGELLYCSPKSPVLGDALKISPNQLYFSNLAIRNKIIKNDCKSCIHDYHEPLTLKEQWTTYLNIRRRSKIYNFPTLFHQSAKIHKVERKTLDVSALKSKKVLIVGWYGTETAGDKAILWSIVHKLRSRQFPPKQITISSLYPFVSRWTVKEMELHNISIVETYTKEFEKACEESDEVVVGGGPLMDIEPLNHILYAFTQAKRTKAVTRVEGCGLGPLSEPVFVQAVGEILRLSDHIALRDKASVERCIREFEILQALTVPDPATDYVQHVKNNQEMIASKPAFFSHAPRVVACFLREWSREYASNMDAIAYQLLKQSFEVQLSELVGFVAQTCSADVYLLPMHTFYIGGDDRVFNRRLAQSISRSCSQRENEPKPTINCSREPVSPMEILQSMYYADFNLCMRFHSVLFAETLGVPYVAIDYTGGGKIKSFLQDKGKLHKLISLEDIAKGNWKDTILGLIAESK